MKAFFINLDKTTAYVVSMPELDKVSFPFVSFIRKNLKKFNVKITSLSKIKTDDGLALVAFIEGLPSNTSGLQELSFNDLPKSLTAEIEIYKKYLQSISLVKEWHGEQKYSFLELPYYYHLKQTEKVVDHFFWELPAGKTTILKIAALLHDVLEDTKTNAKELAALFGEETLDIVSKVTKVNEVNSVDFETSYYANMASNPLAVCVKIADKCANTKQTVKYFSDWHATRIIDGHPIFQKQTYEYLDAPFMKHYLDSLVGKLEGMRK